MNQIKILKFDTCDAPAEEYFLPADKLISGNPKQTVWQHYTDPTKKFLTGIWQSDVGKWRIAYSEEEYCQILEGTSIITDQDGNAVTVSGGENFVIPRGFVGSWEVIERTKKIYVMYEAGN